MNKTKKELAQTWKQLCSTAEPGCDIYVDKNMPLPMIMVQGWFGDQWECFKSFRKKLTNEEQTKLFTMKCHLESVKAKYKRLWDTETFKTITLKKKKLGAHRRLNHLHYKNFCHWAKCVFNEVAKAGGLKKMLKRLGTVEEAHSTFKYFYKTKPVPVRKLSAADAARILARYGYLQPEERPLLARGALRGAAICVDKECPLQSIEDLEKKYKDEEKRRALEERAAAYINESEELSQGDKWKMEKGESIFCELQKQPGVSHQSKRKKR